MKSLKYIIAVLVFTNTAISFSQNNNFTVSTPAVNILYKGFDNQIEIGFIKKKVKYTVECIGCDTLFKAKKFDNLYVVKLGLDSLPEIEILIKNKKGKLLQTVIYKAIFLPKPSLKLGKYNGLDTIDSLTSDTKLSVKKNIDFFISYVVGRWKITINGKTFIGHGSDLSKEVLDFMKEVERGVVLFEVNYYGPYSKGKAKVKEVFILNL